MKTGITAFRSNNTEHQIILSYRDVRILDAKYFLNTICGWDGYSLRRLFGLDFISGFGPPPRGVVLRTESKDVLLSAMQDLLRALKNQEDLITYHYSYQFTGEGKQRGGGGRSGFRIKEMIGHIDVRPSGFCDLELWELCPDGKYRPAQIIDMRIIKEIETDSLGLLKIHRKKTPVGWFEELPRLIIWLETNAGDKVEILHL